MNIECLSQGEPDFEACKCIHLYAYKNKVINEVIKLLNYVEAHPVCKFLVQQGGLITTLAGDFSTT